MRLSTLVLFCLALLPVLSGCGAKGVSAAAKATARSIEVRVVEAGTRVPVEGVTVALFLDGGKRDVAASTTGEEGTAFWDYASRVTRVQVRDPRHRYISIEAGLPGPSANEGSTENVRTVTVELERGATVTLSVRGATDGTLLSSRVKVWSSDPSRRARRHERRRGDPLVLETPAGKRTTLGPLAPGPAKILVASPGYTTRILDVTVPSSTDDWDLGDVRLFPGGAHLVGVADSSLEIQPDEAYLRFAGVGVAVALDRGRFEFNGLPRTDGTLVLRREGRELFSKSVVVDGPRLDLGIVRP